MSIQSVVFVVAVALVARAVLTALGTRCRPSDYPPYDEPPR